MDEVEKKELIDLVKKINQNKTKDKELSEHALREYKKAIRKLYTDYLPSKNPEFDGDHLCDFFTLTIDTKKVDRDNLLKPIQVRKLIASAERTRDKAFMMVLWSSVGRIGEVLGLKWRDIRFGEDIAKLVFMIPKMEKIEKLHFVQVISTLKNCRRKIQEAVNLKHLSSEDYILTNSFHIKELAR